MNKIVVLIVSVLLLGKIEAQEYDRLLSVSTTYCKNHQLTCFPVSACFRPQTDEASNENDFFFQYEVMCRDNQDNALQRSRYLAHFVFDSLNHYIVSEKLETLSLDIKGEPVEYANPNDKWIHKGFATDTSLIAAKAWKLCNSFCLQENTNVDTIYRYGTIDVNPLFLGQDATLLSLRDYMVKNLEYPPIQDGISGRVFVEFIIEKDGSISGITILRSIDTSIDVEAVKMIRGMPRWTPGMMNGKPVRVSFIVPVSFNLYED